MNANQASSDVISAEIADHLARHSFRDLFIETLGWDRSEGTVALQAGGRPYALERIAHKRGLQVVHCSVGCLTALNRGVRRKIQSIALKINHEHIIVYSSDTPPRQAWQWVVHLPIGRRLRHREQVFFSNDPPQRLLSRLKQLQWNLEDEESNSLGDVLQRVREVLDTTTDFHLFAKRSRNAEQSDALARAMKSGGVAEFQAFVAFHLPLIQWAAKRFHQRLHLDIDDAEQFCALGLMRAAEKFDPKRRTQFSTYAIWWMHQRCQRLGAEWRFLIHLPMDVLDDCRRLQKELRGIEAARGASGIHEYLYRLAKTNNKLVLQWLAYVRSKEICSLSDRRTEAYRAARRIRMPAHDPLERLMVQDTARMVTALVASLPERDQMIIKLRFGFNGEPQTLAEIGATLGVTRERIRQKEERIMARLHYMLCRQHGPTLEQIWPDGKIPPPPEWPKWYLTHPPTKKR